MRNILPVILSGGSGTRLWPLSRSLHPKQFINGLHDEGVSLFGTTLGRLPESEDFLPPLIVSNSEHRFLIKDELELASVVPRGIILEPVARNTCPAIAVAALLVAQTSPETILAVMPSDHLISDRQRFARRIGQAAEFADTGRLVLFGIPPTEPHTGYGYIRKGDSLGGNVFSVDRFFEKPDQSKATQYCSDDRYFWNSGIFIFQATALLREIRTLAPKVLEAAEAALKASTQSRDFLHLDSASFASSPSISIDCAVMESTEAAAMLSLDTGWSDLGSWSSLWSATHHDSDGNRVVGDAILNDSHDCYVHSSRSLIAAIGVQDLVIVETPDAVLVADKRHSTEVGQVAKLLKESDRDECEQHLRKHRPWGFFETLSIGGRFQVKLLHVKPGGKLSLQMHHHRSEHWVVVKGTAKVIIGKQEKLVSENESVYITATQWHRLENPGKVPLELIEVQIGTYLGEDDIIRSDDIYQRTDDETG
jgi:mannose-1-phosphate guanylyltransferase / mannose-6-phosphate isomerase